MKSIQKEAQGELLLFLEKFDLSDVMKHTSLAENISKTFKYYYPVLLLEAGIGMHPPWKQKDKVDTFHLYFKESISDVCQALVLTAAGFYKPAQLSLRSGLENWVRCIGLAEGQNVLALRSVFELMDLVKSIPAVSTNPLATNYFATLRNRYALLCGYVHTSNAAHMALTTVAGAYPRFLEKEAEETFAAIGEVCSRIVFLFCILAEKTYRGLHHRHFDIVSDALPKKLKAYLNT